VNVGSATSRNSRSSRAVDAQVHSHNQKVVAVCAYTNPFCAAATNARWPDGMGTRTMSATVRGVVMFNSDAEGELGFAIRPAYTYNYISGTVANTTLTTGGTWGEVNTAITVQQYRVTSCGVRISSNMPALTETGQIFIASTNQVAINTAYNVASPTPFTELYMGSLKGAVVHEWVAKPIGPRSRMLVDTNLIGADTSAVDSGWSEMLCVCNGLPVSVTGAVRMEFILNIEYTTPATSGLGFLAKPSPIASPPLQQAVAIVHSKTPQTMALPAGSSSDGHRQSVAASALAALPKSFWEVAADTAMQGLEYAAGALFV
jgi:hypothetical protein